MSFTTCERSGSGPPGRGSGLSLMALVDCNNFYVSCERVFQPHLENRPVVVLANLSGFDGSPESMRKLQLEYGAEIGRAVVNFDGPILFLVVSRYHGGAYVVFSQELNPGLRAMAVEGTYASVIGGGPAAAVVFPREVDKPPQQIGRHGIRRMRTQSHGRKHSLRRGQAFPNRSKRRLRPRPRKADHFQKRLN